MKAHLLLVSQFSRVVIPTVVTIVGMGTGLGHRRIVTVELPPEEGFEDHGRRFEVAIADFMVDLKTEQVITAALIKKTLREEHEARATAKKKPARKARQ